MSKIIIEGNKVLSGTIRISGAKNSVVALIPAAILADSPVTLEGVPDIQDVHSLLEIFFFLILNISQIFKFNCGYLSTIVLINRQSLSIKL